MYIVKGSRIVAWIPGIANEVTGIVRHWDTNAPINPSKITLKIEPEPGAWPSTAAKPRWCYECEKDHVVIDYKHIVSAREP